MDGMSRDLRNDAIAKEIAWGLTPGDAARIHGLTPVGIGHILQREDVQQWIADYREMFMARAKALQAELLMLTDFALPVVREALTAPGVTMRDKLAAAKWVLEPMIALYQQGQPGMISDNAGAIGIVGKLAEAIDKLADSKRAHEVDVTPRPNGTKSIEETH